MKSRSPTVSVIIPTYNRATDLRRAINSVISQTFKDWEIVIVDNHSTDETDELVASLSKYPIRLEKIHNHGIIAASRNRGIQRSRGQFLAFLDSDDWWMPTKLESALAAFADGADVVYHSLIICSPQKRPFYRREARARPLRAPVFRDLLINGNALPNSSVVIRKALAVESGPINEESEYRSWEDYDYWMRLARITDRFACLNRPLGYYWLGSGNTSNDHSTLINIDRFVDKYREAIQTHCGRFEPCWVTYTRHRLGQRNMRIGDFLLVPDGSSLSIRLRMAISWFARFSRLF